MSKFRTLLMTDPDTPRTIAVYDSLKQADKALNTLAAQSCESDWLDLRRTRLECTDFYGVTHTYWIERKLREDIMRKNAKPTKTMVKNWMLTMSTGEIAKMRGVCHSTAAKWIRHYNLGGGILKGGDSHAAKLTDDDVQPSSLTTTCDSYESARVRSLVLTLLRSSVYAFSTST